jgi:hypothetical protein
MEEPDLPPAYDVPLADLVDTGPHVPAHADALRSIVARTQRWRVRSLAGALLAVALLGPLAGYAVGHSRAPATTVASAPRSTGTPSAATPAQVSSGGGYTAVAEPAGTSTPPRQLFVRDTADGVRLRAYLQDFSALKTTTVCPAPPVPANGATVAAPACAPAVDPSCLPAGMLQAEVSDDQVAGATMVPVAHAAATQPVEVLEASVVGSGQPAPIGVVIVRTSSAVRKVVLSLKGGGTDQMTPTADGYAVLAGNVTGLATTTPAKPAAGAPNLLTIPVGFGFPEATLTAYDASGAALPSVTLPGTATAPPATCLLKPLPAPGPGGAVGGSVGSSGSGTVSSGTVTSGSGSVSSSGGASSTGSAPATTSTP